MPALTFNQTTSVVRRLRAILIAIAVFFLIGTFSIYFSSQEFLTGLQDINTDNKVLGLTSNAMDALTSSEEVLTKIGTDVNPRHLRFAFSENIKLAREKISEAENLNLSSPISSELDSIRTSIELYADSVEAILAGLTATPVKKKPLKDDDGVNSDVLVAKEFVTDAKESIRKIQITLKNESENLFQLIYRNRFRPLFVTTALSLVFFIFVIVVGLSNAKRISLSISNLTIATDEVSDGNLSFEAPIMEYDEIGNLTFEFNRMVKSMNKNQSELQLTLDRITQLQNITTLFAGAVTPAEVYETIFHKVFDAINVSAGGVAILGPDQKTLEIRRVSGYDSEVTGKWQTFDLFAPVPVAEAVRTNESVFYPDIEVFKEKFPGLRESFEKAGFRAYASLPLKLGTLTLGGISFAFQDPHEFGAAEKDFLLSMSRQCAQAIHRSQLYEDARAAVQVRDEFLSIASHELRTPLTPLKMQVQGLSRLILKGGPDALTIEKLLKGLQSSDKQINRLTTLIDDLLDVSRITSGRLTLNKEELDLEQLILDVIDQYRHQLEDKNSTLEFQKSESVAGCFDKVRLEQVFVNLLTNAGKYAPGKPISISLEKKENLAVIKVKDEGPGIARENQTRIFNRFERVKERDNVGGLGLGLYISRQIVEAHDGLIKVESVVGEGATFIVEIPLS